MSLARLYSFTSSEAMNDYYSLQLDEQIATARFYEEEGIGRPDRDTTKGIELDSTLASFFEDCWRYGAAESVPSVIWTDDRALVVWVAIGDIATISDRWPNEWLSGPEA